MQNMSDRPVCQLPAVITFFWRLISLERYARLTSDFLCWVALIPIPPIVYGTGVPGSSPRAYS